MKLGMLMLCANLAGLIVAIVVARAVREVPESATVESALLAAYYASMLVVGAVDALLLDELLFSGAFRRTHLEGQRVRPATDDDELPAVVATMQRSTVSFPILVVLCTVLTYGEFNQVNDSFDEYHRRVGRHLGALRRGDEAERIQAIQAIAVLRGNRLALVAHALFDALEQGGPPARWAAWGLGHMSDLKHRRPFIGPLVSASRSGDLVLQHVALIALGRLQHRPIVGAIQSEVRRQIDASEPIDPRLLYALGSVQDLSSRDLLVELLHRADEPTQGLAAWALAQHRDEAGARDAVGPVLEERLATASLRVRCDILHGLTIFADERSNLALMAAYDEATPDERVAMCQRRGLSMQPDGSTDDRIDLFMPEDIFAMRVIAAMAQVRATAPAIRAQVEPWLEHLIADASTDPTAREGARSLLLGIHEQRDDSKRPSVEAALGLP